MLRILNKPYVSGALAMLLGALATLAFAPFDCKLLSPLALAGVISLASMSTPLKAFRLGWLFGFAHFASGIYWTFISTHVYGGAPAWLGLLLCVLLYAYMALYPALAMLAVAWIAARKPALVLLAAPAAFTLTELLRGWWWTGFPWLSQGYVALDTPLASLAPLVGMHGLSFLLVLIAAALLSLVREKARAPAAWAALALTGLAVWLAPQPLVWTHDSGPALSTAIIQGQGEIRMNEKWKPETRELLVTRFRDMTLSARDAQLVVWPEGPLPATYAALQPYYLADLDSLLKPTGAALFLGVLVESEDHSGLYNSVILQGAAGGRYDKRHLVPFGEFFPIPDWLRPMMDVLGTPYSDFAFGKPEQPLLEAQGQKIFANICFEDVFADEFRRHAQGAALLINQTNDSWFGEGVAPFQHLQIARMRALENGRWFIRATNSGISALIGPGGEVAAKTSGLYEVALLRGQVRPRAGATPYARFGDAPLWAACALLLFGSLLLVSRISSKSQVL